MVIGYRLPDACGRFPGFHIGDTVHPGFPDGMADDIDRSGGEDAFDPGIVGSGVLRVTTDPGHPW